MSRIVSAGIKDLAPYLNLGPVAIIRDEDGVDLDQTIEHAQAIGFENIILLAAHLTERASVLQIETPPEMATNEVVNPLLDGLAGRWIYLGHNAEYLYFPFCEGRTISDAAQFVEEERRDAVFCTTVDLYPAQIDRFSMRLDPEQTHFDGAGYFAHDRYDGPDRLERQIEVFGGLKWRYAEHVEWKRQRIDRIGFFRAKEGLQIDALGRLNDAEMNTVSCPWHNNMSFCVASFRVAKSLLNNPGSAYEVESFMWEQSLQFDWSSEALMKVGLMEPGQWF